MWHGALIGNRVFWGLVDALHEAGLVALRKGTRGIGVELDPGDWWYSRAFGGQPSKVWPTETLLELAAQHGVTPNAVASDWPVSRKAETKRINVAPDRLVTCLTFRDDTPVQLPPEQCAQAEAMQRDVALLNAIVAQVEIRGCRAPAFRRAFRHDLRLGGRYYAVGNGSFQGMPEEERARITINGEPTVEVDIHACNLSIFLALTGTRELPAGDLYEFVKLPDGTPNARDAVKEWFVETFGNGRLVAHWARSTPEQIKSIRPSVIRAAALRAYPTLANLTAIIPPDLAAELAALPAEERGKAVGLYLTHWEARVIEGALGYLRACEVIGLPMHDALIVPARAAKQAREAISGAFGAYLKVAPRFK
jgi:hypothetical protein